MRITKLLALAASAIVVAACNGNSPMAPDPASVASDDATAVVNAQAQDFSEGSPCRNITDVRLLPLRSPGNLKVQAIYMIHGAPARCQIPPNWSSRPTGRIRPTADPFIVEVRRTRPPSTVQVAAEAPNGVRGSILLE